MFFFKKSRSKALHQATLAEFLGAFFLALMVTLSVALPVGIPTPVVAGLTLGLLVYTIGSVSGAHVNPAITLGLYVLNKIDATRATRYIIAQLCGGVLAWILVSLVQQTPFEAPNFTIFSMPVLLGEIAGTIVLAVGVASVVYDKVSRGASGLTIGGSLMLGAVLAGPFSTGVLNPAVAIGLGSASALFLIAPLIGGVLGMWIYRELVG